MIELEILLQAIVTHARLFGTFNTSNCCCVRKCLIQIYICTGEASTLPSAQIFGRSSIEQGVFLVRWEAYRMIHPNLLLAVTSLRFLSMLLRLFHLSKLTHRLLLRQLNPIFSVHHFVNMARFHCFVTLQARMEL